MHANSAFDGLRCLDCGTTFDTPAVEYRCQSCDGLLAATYERDGTVDAADLAAGQSGLARYAGLLPFPTEALVTLDEGATPMVECPALADELGVAAAHVKEEGRNPTGSVADRGMALAVTAAVQSGASGVELPTTGNGGQSAAAYAARAGIEARAFVPTRSPFVNKAMVNVHGGDMRVVEGRYDDALATYEANRDEDAVPVGPASAYRREGHKTLFYEVAADRGWSAPDAVVVPTGHGTVLAGVHAAVTELADAGVVADRPRLYAAQPEGCAPVVDAVDGSGSVEPVEHPDTIVGPLEVADPAAGDHAVRAVGDTDGRAVAVDDDAVLEAAVDAASDDGVEVGATGGVGVAAARALADEGAFGPDESVVVVNPVAGSKESDLLRSYLMGQGR